MAHFCAIGHILIALNGQILDQKTSHLVTLGTLKQGVGLMSDETFEIKLSHYKLGRKRPLVHSPLKRVSAHQISMLRLARFMIYLIFFAYLKRNNLLRKKGQCERDFRPENTHLPHKGKYPQLTSCLTCFLNKFIKFQFSVSQ